MKTSLVQLRIGDSVIYEPNGRHLGLIVIDYKLTPNGINSPELVCLITAEAEGRTIEATSDKFILKPEGNYTTIYQTFNTK